jgi:hypothetical protein
LSITSFAILLRQTPTKCLELSKNDHITSFAILLRQTPRKCLKLSKNDHQ